MVSNDRLWWLASQKNYATIFCVQSWIQTQNNVLWTHDLQVHGSKRLCCHATLLLSACVTLEMNLRITTSKRPAPSLKPRTDVTRSPKHWYQWPYEKELCLSIFWKKLCSDLLNLCTRYSPNWNLHGLCIMVHNRSNTRTTTLRNSLKLILFLLKDNLPEWKYVYRISPDTGSRSVTGKRVSSFLFIWAFNSWVRRGDFTGISFAFWGNWCPFLDFWWRLTQNVKARVNSFTLSTS